MSRPFRNHFAAAFVAIAPALAAQNAPPTRAPLMDLLNDIDLAKPLEDLGVQVFGFANAGYTWSTRRPESGTIEARYFDFEHNKLRAHQVDLTFERAAPLAHETNFGFRFESLVGHDAGLVHANGLFDTNRSPRSPEIQYDLLQAYADLVLPVADGLRVRAGKFLTPVGYETTLATGVPFHSLSLLFNFAEPFTHTGALATLGAGGGWTANAGIVRGWDQAIEDNNDAYTAIGGATWSAKDNSASFGAWVLHGPERADDNRHNRTLLDLVGSLAIAESTTAGINIDFGVEPGARTSSNGDARWYGVALYLSRTLSDRATANLRAEWFRDEGGTRTGFDAALYEVTAGVSLRPFGADGFAGAWTFRPEVRADFASDPIFDGGRSSSQVTLAFDVIFRF